MKTSHSVIIHRPLAEVFAFVTDLRNETRWQPEIQSVTVEGPLAAGATFRETRVTFGRRFDWRFRITSYDAPDHITIETIEGAAPYRGTRSFEAVGGSTRVTESGELELPGLLAIFTPLVQKLSKRPLRAAYERLKMLLESPTATYAGSSHGHEQRIELAGERSLQTPAGAQLRADATRRSERLDPSARLRRPS